MSALVVAASCTAEVLADESNNTTPLFRMCFLALGDEDDAVAWKRAYVKACEVLKYKTTMCRNEDFKLCGVCSYEVTQGQFVHRCRFAHSESERRQAPTKADLENEARKLVEAEYMC